jgi:hypothetical protein
MSSAVARGLLAAWICCALPFAARAGGKLEPRITSEGTEHPAPTTDVALMPGDVGTPSPSDGPARMVIVTDATLGPAFRRLADAHDRDGLVTRVRTLQSIRDAYPAGRDDAERIRLFLKDARANWGIEFALMGGDEPLIPMRRAFISHLPLAEPGSSIALPTDQYYACLDGDWNADGDARWAETPDPSTGDPGDDADVIPELCVGRAPVLTRQQANDFVDKTLRALRLAPPADSLDVLLVAGGLFVTGFPPVSLLSTVAEGLRGRIDTTTSARFTRLYRDPEQWPGASLLTPASMLAALEQGPDLSVFLGGGAPGFFSTENSDPTARVSGEDLLALQGGRDASHVAVLSAYTTAPGILSIGAALVRAKHGGSASVLGPSDIEFVALTSAYLQDYIVLGLTGHDPTIGEAMRANLRSTTLPTESDFARLTTFGNNLLGDPTLPFPVVTAPAALRSALPAGSAPSSTAATAGRTTVALDPAHAHASVVLTLAAREVGQPLDVSVLDLAGRRVRTLEHGVAASSTRELAWDLRDARGARVPNGLYFVRTSVGTEARVNRVVVW